jgi:hypothetical protein
MIEEGLWMEYRIISTDDFGDWYPYDDDLFFSYAEDAWKFIEEIKEKYPDEEYEYKLESRQVTKWEVVNGL